MSECTGIPPLRRQSSEGATCRICYCGVEEGYLFKPCRCSGTMKYIHVRCLEHWRASGPNNAKYECPQCHYRYNLSRLTVSGWLGRPSVVPTLTFIIFLAFWFACALISLASAMVGIDIKFLGDVPQTWEHMFNGIILAGLFGAIYSCLADEACRALFAPRYAGRPRRPPRAATRTNTRSSSLVVAVIIILGLLRAVAAIYAAVSALASGARDGLRNYVLDIRDVEGERAAAPRGEKAADALPLTLPVQRPASAPAAP